MQYNLDISQRQGDGQWVVWFYGWVPDEYLDNNPKANADYLRRTRGWRAAAWQPAFVGSREACESYVNSL